MKVSKFYFPLLAAGVFASCSSESEPVVDNGTNNGEAQYLAVNICVPSETSTRATAEDFEDGEASESTAAKGMFLFFNGETQTQTPQTASLEWTNKGNSVNAAITNISTTTVVIAGSTQPKEVMVILNAPSDMNLAGLSKSEVLGQVKAYDVAKADNFIMTNSSYFNGTDPVIATNIEGKTFKTEAEAKQDENVVDIYVERLAVKITTTGLDEMGITPTTKDIEGLGELTLTPKILGYEIANSAKESYLFKNLDANWIKTWEGVNDAANFRSYWAVPYGEMTYANKSWTVMNGSALEEDGSLKANLLDYVRENTSPSQHTAILLTAQLMNGDEEVNSFVRWGGNYYGKDAFLAQYVNIAKNGGFYKVETVEDGKITKAVGLASTDFEWLSNDDHEDLYEAGDLEQYETTATVTFNNSEGTSFAVGDVVKQNGNDFIKVTDKDVNAFLMKKENRVWMWTNGKCYYYVDIKHFGDAPYNVGVVRNHVYKLSLTDLKGLGVPVPNPDEIIIPTTPVDELFYLGARLNILKWRIVGQEVKFDNVSD